MIFFKSKKAVSAVITTVIMVALSIALIAILWVFIQGLIEDRIGESEACFGILDKVKFNGKYTCYDSSLGELKFLVSVQDVKVDKLIISIQGPKMEKRIELSNTKNYTYVGNSSGIYETDISAPEENSAENYYVNLTALEMEKPDALSVIPIVEGYSCPESHSLKIIDVCM